MNWSRISIVIIGIVSVYLIFLIFSDLGKIIETISQINKIYLLLSAAIWILVAFMTSIRWYVYLNQIGTKIPFISSSMYYLAGYVFEFSPGGVGEIIRTPFLKRDFNISISKTAPITLVERFYDLLGVIIMICIGLIYSNFDKTIVVIPLGFALTVFIIMKKKSFFLGVIKYLSRFNFVKKMMPNGEESYEVIFNLTNAKNFILGLSISTFKSFIIIVSVYLLISGMHADINFANLSVLYQTSNFIAFVSLMPGGIGVLEGGLIGMLILYKINFQVAVSVAILVRILQTGLLSTIGIICLKMISK